MLLRLLMPLLFLVGCAPSNSVEGTFAGEELNLQSWTMFHWTEGLEDLEGNPLELDRIALSFSETPDLCSRQKEFLEEAGETGVPANLSGAEHDEHDALFEQYFPVTDNWDLTFWIGLPDGLDSFSGVEVDLDEAFDDTWLNAEGRATRWNSTPPGDLLTWRSDRWYGDYGTPWLTRSGTVRIDQFLAGDGVRGSIDAVFADDTGEEAEISITFQMGDCWEG